MKTRIKTDTKTKLLMLILILGLLSQYNLVTAKSKHFRLSAKLEQTEVINELMKFDASDENVKANSNHLTIFNVYGSVSVEGYDGDEVLIEATKQVFANNSNALVEGLDEIGLKFELLDQNMYVYLDSPYTYFDREEGLIWHSDTCWKRNDCSRRHKRKDYKYHMDITVRVPENTNLKVSTINNGDIKISGVDAKEIHVNNINGAIDMEDVAGQTTANAINQDINITYRNNPTADSSYESINGDLNIKYAGQPNAIVVYHTMHGELYSAYDVSMLPAQVQRTSKRKEHGIQYKLDAESRLQIGKGGPEYRFETLNGDIKIQRQ